MGKVEGIKPCPWCKSDQLMHLRGEVGNLHWVHCRTCKAEGPVAMDWNEAKALWDNRDVVEFIDLAEQKPEAGQICIVAAGPEKHAQHAALTWTGSEFVWADTFYDMFDPFPTEIATHWMPFPADPK